LVIERLLSRFHKPSGSNFEAYRERWRPQAAWHPVGEKPVVVDLIFAVLSDCGGEAASRAFGTVTKYG
jgi:hypothetical protein